MQNLHLSLQGTTRHKGISFIITATKTKELVFSCLGGYVVESLIPAMDPEEKKLWANALG